MKIPKFLITIDTEGDNLWNKPRNVTTKNVNYLESFQKLCESYELKPTYLTAYEVACNSKFQEFGKNIIDSHTGEIGMHLHAQNTPPIIPLTKDDYYFQPYLIEYPEKIMRAKIQTMTEKLEQKFEVKMKSHRAGRWGLNETYARILEEYGYIVDCSVTPNVSWKSKMGDPRQKGGIDYTDFPDSHYFINLDNIRLPGNSNLLELPMTIIKKQSSWKRLVNHTGALSKYILMAINQFSPSILWLRPNGKNISSMFEIVKLAIKDEKDYIQLMLHSSELMPGGSPTFPTKRHIERLYEDLTTLFSKTMQVFCGATLEEFHQQLKLDHHHE